MCRLLLVKSEDEFEISSHLKKLAEISKNSKEYQGHGWGCAYLDDGDWQYYWNLKSIWEDNLDQFKKTTQLIAHARSAFQDKGIAIENNMPFHDDKYVYIFNGELQGVKIKERGRIGAEKIFNYIKKFDKGNMLEALKKSIKVIQSRTKYVRALNLIVSDKHKIYLASVFNEDPDYFTMHHKQLEKGFIICSDPYPGEEYWQPIKNGTIREL